MKARVVTGFIAAVGLVALIFRGSPSLVIMVIGLVSAIGVAEFQALFFERKAGFQLFRMMTMVLLIVISLSFYSPYAGHLVLGLFFLHCLWHLCMTFQHPDHATSVRNASLEFFGVLYVSSIFGFLNPILSLGVFGRPSLLLLFLIVSLGDTVAYFAGSAFGRSKIAPHISPKKTREGAAAALISSGIVSVIWYFWMYPGARNARVAAAILLVSLLVSLLAQLGDLFESVLKRAQSKKDSGSLLPGHGGVLDRTDGLAFAAPAFFIFLRYILEMIQ